MEYRNSYIFYWSSNSLLFLSAIIVGLSTFTSSAFANDNPEEIIYKEAQKCEFEGECGFWWGFESQAVQEEQETAKTSKPISKTNKEDNEKRCSSSETWSKDCGFIDPGDDFDFMAKQRDELSKNALMNNSDQAAVHAFQKYMAWAVDASVTMARTWEYNMIQDQDINPFAKHPISRFGLKATLSSLNNHKKDIFQEIADQGGVLVFWSRQSCSWCHQLRHTYEDLSIETGIPLYNISIEGPCIEGFQPEYCSAESEETKVLAQALQIKVVPDLFLLLDRNNSTPESWVRVSTGFEAQKQISTRIYTYFEGIRAASRSGLSAAANHFRNQKRPGVSFESENYEPSNIGTYK